MSSLLRLLSFFMLTACASKPRIAEPTVPLEPAIARVNGVVIPARIFYDELEKITARGPLPHEQLVRVADKILEGLIAEELIAQAVKRANIVVPQAVIDEGLREYRERFGSEEQYQSFMQSGKVTIETVAKRIRDRHALEMLLGPRLEFTRDQARASYNEDLQLYTMSAGIRVSQMRFKLSDPPTGDELVAVNERVKQAQVALAAGEDFNTVAARLADGSPQEVDTGWFGEGRMVREFEEAAFKLAIGEVSGPVRTRFGVHLIRMVARREARTLPFEEVEEEVLKSLRETRLIPARRELLAELRENAQIEKLLPAELQPPPGSFSPM